MYVHQGGEQYGFCPAKSTWDFRLAEVYRLLVIASETGAMIKGGGLLDQPAWFVEMLGWFLPLYGAVKFNQRVKSVMGDGKSQTPVSIPRKGP